MRNIIFIIAGLLFSTFVCAQNGISYQALILNPTGEQLPGQDNSNTPLSNKHICLRFSIIDHLNQIEYMETQQVTTDTYGMVNLIIGTGLQVGGYASSFSNVVWGNNPKNLKVELDVTAQCVNFVQISYQPFTFVPLAYYALNSGNSGGSNVPLATTTSTGIIQLAGDLGGTALAPTVPGLALKENIITPGTTLQYWRGDKSWQILDKLAVGLGNVDNTSDIDKPISTATQAALNGKEDLINKSVDVVVDALSDIKYPSVKAIKTYVDGLTAAGVVDATTTVKGKIQLAGDLTGTAALPTIANNAVTTGKILDGTIASADLADGAVTAVKLNQMAATSGQVLKWNGTAWAPAADTDTDTNTTYTGSTSVSLNGTSFERPALTGDVTAAANSNATTIANNAVTTSKILDGTIATADLADGNVTMPKIAQAGATSGQVIKWNGTAWAPATDSDTTYSAGSGVTITAGSIAVNDATTTAKGIVQLAGDLGGTADLPTVPGLALKEDLINKATTFVANESSDVKYPTVKAVVDYIAYSDIKSIASNYTILGHDYTLLCDTSIAGFTLTLPAPSLANKGKIYVINKVDESNNVLGFVPSLKLSNTSNVTSLNYSAKIYIQSDGLSWVIIK